MTQPQGKISSLRTVGAFLNGRACSDTLCHVINRAFYQPMQREERAAMPFAGGIMQHGHQCGMLWGATLAAGAQAFRLFGPGSKAEAGAIVAAQKLVESFRADQNTINCFEITELNRSSTTMQMITYFLIKGGTIGCLRMAARYAAVAFEDINAVFSGELEEAPVPPVSCAAMLARKRGVSDLHQTMAAGLAGGIGLSGGACGALGAAIWILGMNTIKEGGKTDYKSPKALEVIEQFLKCTDYEFDCSKIVGRQFESIDDHAAYMSEGGCSKVLELLAAA